MLKKLKRNIVTVLSVATLGFAVLAPIGMAGVASAAATNTDIQGSLCAGSNLNIGGTGGDPNCSSTGTTESSISTLAKKIINVFSVIVGVIAVVMIIIGGLRYITSGGDSNNVSSAKNTLIYAIVGLVIVALAQIIVHWVLAQTSGI